MSDTKAGWTRRRNDPQDRSALRKAERTRQAILDAAMDFLWSNPFRDLTITELMNQAAASRPAFYQYFADLHDLMENLLIELQHEILEVVTPWLTAKEDPAAKLAQSLAGLVKVCYRRGPLIRAVVEAAPMDERLERAWNEFIGVFDNAVANSIERDRAAGLVADFDARHVAIALNRMDVGTFIHHFGRRPRSQPEPVLQSIMQLWISTIYGRDSLERLVQDDS